MKNIKVRLGVLTLGLSLFVSVCMANDSEVELYESCNNGKGGRYAISTSRANQLPKWNPGSQTEPPLSIKKAVTIGAKKTNQPANNLHMVHMGKAFNTGVWYYQLTFVTITKGKPPEDDSRITLLMDGSAVVPQSVECR